MEWSIVWQATGGAVVGWLLAEGAQVLWRGRIWRLRERRRPLRSPEEVWSDTIEDGQVVGIRGWLEQNDG